MYDHSYFKGSGFDQKYGYREYAAMEPLKRLTFERWLSDVEQFSQGKRLLEIGCATGVMLDVARNAGWEAVGIDLSEYAVSVAQSKGLEAYAGDTDSLSLEGEPFDAVLMLDLLEHLPDPASALLAANRLLKPRGVVYVVTPAIDSLSARIQRHRWPHYKPVEHLCLFTRKAMKRAFERNGFEVARIRGARKITTLSHIMTELEATNRILSGVLNMMSRLTPRLMERPLYLSLGEMCAVGRKA